MEPRNREHLESQSDIFSKCRALTYFGATASTISPFIYDFTQNPYDTFKPQTTTLLPALGFFGFFCFFIYSAVKNTSTMLGTKQAEKHFTDQQEEMEREGRAFDIALRSEYTKNSLKLLKINLFAAAIAMVPPLMNLFFRLPLLSSIFIIGFSALHIYTAKKMKPYLAGAITDLNSLLLHAQENQAQQTIEQLQGQIRGLELVLVEAENEARLQTAFSQIGQAIFEAIRPILRQIVTDEQLDLFANTLYNNGRRYTVGFFEAIAHAIGVEAPENNNNNR